MERFIKDPHNYTYAQLQNNDWDILETNITVDVDAFKEWSDTVQEKFSDCGFNFIEHMHLLKPAVRERKDFFYSDAFLVRNADQFRQWTLQWSYQRDGAIPLLQIADIEQFPEGADPNELKKVFNINLEKYYFGMYKKYQEALGDDVFKVTRLVRFGKDNGLRVHTDNGPDEPNLIRMHLQIEVNPSAWIKFGENLDRSYTPEVGKVYFYNTSVHHSAMNEANTPWTFLHNDPLPESIDKLLQTKIHIGK